MRDRVEGPAFDSLVALYQGPALAVPHVVPPLESARPVHRAKRRNSNRRKCSIARLFTLLEYPIRKDAIPKNFLCLRFKVGPLDRSLFFSFGHNAGDYVVALAQLDRLACPKPLFQASGITQLRRLMER